MLNPLAINPIGKINSVFINKGSGKNKTPGTLHKTQCTEKIFLLLHPGFNNIFPEFFTHLECCFIICTKMNARIKP